MEASGLLLAALPFCTSNSLSFSSPVLMKFHWLVVGPQRGVPSCSGAAQLSPII